ncbi:hypothetical protein DFH07DRAFT_763587 [Mycena maculata]|uniref:Uncharacterized protein n=1 Tax=Mycena maculata TaxID=230809 RepID=A0AAD7KHS8_9AGAR|nr:hypothetical protein DFH07DRAFT_763587 [Mycena maculata]
MEQEAPSKLDSALDSVKDTLRALARVFKPCIWSALSLLFASVGLVRAIDNFLLYDLPPEVTVDQFTDAFDDLCTIWPAAIAQDLTFFDAQVEPPVDGSDPNVIVKSLNPVLVCAPHPSLTLHPDVSSVVQPLEIFEETWALEGTDLPLIGLSGTWTQNSLIPRCNISRREAITT